MLRILVIGFGPLAREIVGRIKHFPEYGFNNKVYIYHIHVRRNSLSYGEDLVVEYPDPHGDGYRTYNDGLQALDNYSTTVSNYEPWLLEQASEGAFQLIIDCTSGNTEDDPFLGKLAAATDVKWIAAKSIGADSTIDAVRLEIDGGNPWTPVEFTEDFLREAANAWSAAQIKMAGYHRLNRLRDINQRGNPDKATSLFGFSMFTPIPEFDLPILDRFVIKGEHHQGYSRREWYDDQHKCLIIEHDMLTQFFGWHHTEQLAAAEFGIPNIEIDSARYVKYDSDDSTPLPEVDAEYAIDYVHRGTLNIKPVALDFYIDVKSGEPTSGFSYRPRVNAPARKVSNGLEIITFTYKEVEDVA